MYSSFTLNQRIVSAGVKSPMVAVSFELVGLQKKLQGSAGRRDLQYLRLAAAGYYSCNDPCPHIPQRWDSLIFHMEF
jgi:hypothetical protein